MRQLFVKDTNEFLGYLSDEQLKFMIDQLEEESIYDRDYAITPMLLEFFEGQNADPNLMLMLRQALGDAEEVTVFWED